MCLHSWIKPKIQFKQRTEKVLKNVKIISDILSTIDILFQVLFRIIESCVKCRQLLQRVNIVNKYHDAICLSAPTILSDTFLLLCYLEQVVILYFQLQNMYKN